MLEEYGQFKAKELMHQHLDISLAHGRTAGNSLNCTKLARNKERNIRYMYGRKCEIRDEAHVACCCLVFAPPWSKVGTFLMEFALPDQPGEQDC